MADGKIQLGAVLEQLRSELWEQVLTAGSQELQFEVESVELELKVGVTRGGDVSAKAKFWVLELGAGGNAKSEETQTVKLKLKPRVRGAAKGSETLIGRDDRR
jgi:hypothetical protein